MPFVTSLRRIPRTAYSMTRIEKWSRLVIKAGLSILGSSLTESMGNMDYGAINTPHLVAVKQNLSPKSFSLRAAASVHFPL